MNSTARYQGEDGKDYWERNAKRVREEGQARRASLELLFRASLIESFNVLEVGCGRGDNLPVGGVGIDADSRQLEHFLAGRLGIYGEAHSLPFPRDSFNTVFCVGLLMHFPSPIWQKILKEMFRAAKRTVIIGEYDSDIERPKQSHFWEGNLWRRPYHDLIKITKILPRGWKLLHIIRPLPPFDKDVTFWQWIKPLPKRRNFV